MQNDKLIGAVTWFEDSIIILSGPALAISGIIAGVDLLTGGRILQQISWFSLAWAITLLVSLDFQVLTLGVRARRVYTSKESVKKKVFEIALAVIIAAAISYVSIQMQSIIARVNAENISIDQSAMQLGINTIALIWERSTLVLALIFMAGWLRDHSHVAKPETPQVQQVPALDIASVVDEVVTRLQPQMEQHFKQSIEAVYRQVEIKIEQVVGSTGEIPTINASTLKALQAPASDPVDSLASGNTSDDKSNEQSSYAERFQSKKDMIVAILQRNPQASAQQVMQEAGCDYRTATKWIERLRS